MISFKTSKRSLASSVSSIYLRENEETISASKNSKVPQSYLRTANSNNKSLPVPYNNTTIHETNIPMTIEHSSSQKQYFSLFHTVAYRIIPVETIAPIEHSTNTVETLAAYKTITDDPTEYCFFIPLHSGSLNFTIFYYIQINYRIR